MVYQIKVYGKLDQSWSDWLGGALIDSEFEDNGVLITTLRVAVIDQPALFGILDHIRDMNFLPISVEWIDKEKQETTQGGCDENLRNNKE